MLFSLENVSQATKETFTAEELSYVGKRIVELHKTALVGVYNVKFVKDGQPMFRKWNDKQASEMFEIKSVDEAWLKTIK